MKRTRPTTTTTSDSSSSSKKQRSSGQSTTITAQMNFTDEEYAICLKVLQQVNAATPETLHQAEPSLELLKTLALNVTKKAWIGKQWISVSVCCWNGITTNSETIAVLKSNRDDAFHYDAA